MTQMKLKGLIPNSNNPGGAVGGLLGGLLGKNAAQAQNQNQQAQQQQQQSPQQNAVDQVIGLFGKKKQQQPKK
jgi:cobalamin biosynthesis protein CobD/CbiB